MCAGYRSTDGETKQRSKKCRRTGVRMSTVAPTEELVEDLGVGVLRSLGVPSRRGQQVDEAGERAGARPVCCTGDSLRQFSGSIPSFRTPHASTCYEP